MGARSISLPTDLYASNSILCDSALHLRVRSTGCCAGKNTSDCGCDGGCGIRHGVPCHCASVLFVALLVGAFPCNPDFFVDTNHGRPRRGDDMCGVVDQDDLSSGLAMAVSPIFGCCSWRGGSAIVSAGSDGTAGRFAGARPTRSATSTSGCATFCATTGVWTASRPSPTKRTLRAGLECHLLSSCASTTT